MDTQSWQQEVAKLCADAWNLEARTIHDVLIKIDALVTARVLTVPAVALVLERAGVTQAEADQVAHSIRMAILA